eukprot:6481501-Amphidinium_carterae.2
MELSLPPFFKLQCMKKRNCLPLDYQAAIDKIEMPMISVMVPIIDHEKGANDFSKMPMTTRRMPMTSMMMPITVVKVPMTTVKMPMTMMKMPMTTAYDNDEDANDNGDDANDNNEDEDANIDCGVHIVEMHGMPHITKSPTPPITIQTPSTRQIISVQSHVVPHEQPP